MIIIIIIMIIIIISSSSSHGLPFTLCTLLCGLHFHMHLHGHVHPRTCCSIVTHPFWGQFLLSLLRLACWLDSSIVAGSNQGEERLLVKPLKVSNCPEKDPGGRFLKGASGDFRGAVWGDPENVPRRWN